MNKIKLDIGNGEIHNCWARVVHLCCYPVHRYAIFLDNGSWDTDCRFDNEHRVFYGAD